ncbi:hypothetical protein [Latilactobacillus curvatus]|uniref:hypothetical protein n=2 Tax=Latilactobacillus TaxID=2767885 RepID=UPI0012DB0023|nr:hypothetical protein [Latilactobacillus curvatus]
MRVTTSNSIMDCYFYCFQINYVGSVKMNSLKGLGQLLMWLLTIPSAYWGAKTATTELVKHRNMRLASLENRMNANDNAVQAVLHDSLYKQCTKVIYRGTVTISELDNIEHLFRGYSGVGGNGTGEALYNKVKNLKLIDDKELIEH